MTYKKQLVLPQAEVSELEDFLRENGEFPWNYQVSYLVFFPTNFSMKVAVGRNMNSKVPQVKITLDNKHGSEVGSVVESNIIGPVRLNAGVDSYIVNVVQAISSDQKAVVILD